MKSARIGGFAVVLAVTAGVGPTAFTPKAAQNAEKTPSRVGGSLSRNYDEGGHQFSSLQRGPLRRQFHELGKFGRDVAE